MAKKCLAPGCNNDVFSHKYCSRHQSLRTDEKWLSALAKHQQKRNTPINKVSATQKIKNAAYNARVKEWKKEPENAMCCFPGCNMPVDDNHHAGGKIGPNLMDETKWKPLCRPHHIYVTDHSAEAVRLGLTESRLT